MFENCYSLIFHSVQTIVNRQHAFLNEHGEVSGEVNANAGVVVPKPTRRDPGMSPRKKPNKFHSMRRIRRKVSTGARHSLVVFQCQSDD